MKRRFLKILFASIVAMLCYGCTKPKTYPVIPSIQFVSLTKQRSVLGPDSTTIITISFTDGDGDIGLTPADTLPPFNSGSIYYNDFIVSFFQKQHGIWVEDVVPPGDAGFSGRIPYLTPDGNNKALTGNISMTQYIQLTQLYNNGINDTIHYQVYIYDRALHQSNTITTPDMVISIQ